MNERDGSKGTERGGIGGTERPRRGATDRAGGEGTAAVAASPSRYVVVGLGGVGGIVLRMLVPFLHHEARSHGGRPTILAVDGDRFEERNRERMVFGRLGPKAEVLVEELSGSYGDRLTLLPVAEYVTPQRARALIQEGDVVFCAPDNHATRRLVERRCGRLRDVALFSGGNDGVEGGRTGTIGNVQAYLRSGGRDVTNPLSAFHPEIARPNDAVPGSQGCAVLAASAPQLLFTNLAVASALLGTYYAWRCGTLAWEEAYFDILTGRSVPVQRRLRRFPSPARPVRAGPRTSSGSS